MKKLHEMTFDECANMLDGIFAKMHKCTEEGVDLNKTECQMMLKWLETAGLIEWHDTELLH